MSKKLSIVFAAAECAPFAKVGGLGDVIGSLPQAIADAGCTVSVILPLYGTISRQQWGLKKYGTIHFGRNKKKESCTIWKTTLPQNTVTYFFIEHALFKKKEIYKAGSVISSGIDPDIDKFAFYCEAVVETIQQIKIPADIIHCHDWHAALIPTFVDQLAVTKHYPFTKTVYTIHNLGNQGSTRRTVLRKLDLKMSEPAIIEDYYDLDDKHLNLMKIGVLSADKITTVSPNYAMEIMTPEFGAGLESFLQRRKKDVSGILNGIDTKLFDPAADRSIAKKFSLKNWKQGKAVNKKSLQSSLALPQATVPVYGLVSRLVAQKGIDILIQSLEQFLLKNIQVVVLGTGEKALELQLDELAKRFPKKMKALIGFDLKIAQHIYAGSDFFLMPSRFEPCGLGQLIAMRYGTVPIVRSTGGLKDTVKHMQTGIIFSDYTSEALSHAFEESYALYANKKKYSDIAECSQKQNFSWESSAKKYLRLYDLI